MCLITLTLKTRIRLKKKPMKNIVISTVKEMIGTGPLNKKIFK